MRAKPLVIAIGFFVLAVSIVVTWGCGAGEPGSQGIVFANPDIESAVRSTLGKRSGPVYSTELEDITKISVSLRDGSNLSDLQYFANLTNLHLWSSRIIDISSLSSHTKLTTLSLECNEISDISSLSSLTNLTELYLWSNEIEDISPLSSLTSLTRLHLWNNRITDISPLSSLTNLRELDLWGNDIGDVAPLLNNNGLGEGDEVWLANNRLDLWEDNLDSSQQSEDLADIRALQDKGLTVHYDRILVRVNFPDENLNAAIKKALGKQPADAAMSSELSQIISLNATGLNITDLDGIEYCTNLAYLILGGNRISDISLLSSLTKLTLLGLEYNLINDISPLSSLTNMSQLGLTRNRIDDISALSSLTDLTELTLTGNTISDISPLLENSGLGSGDVVKLAGNPLNDDSMNIHVPELERRGLIVSGSALVVMNVTFPDDNLDAAVRKALGKQQTESITSTELAGITSFDVFNSGITDLEGIEYCINLTLLSLGANRISDISPLSSLTNLTSLGLENNGVSDISPLSSLTGLTNLGLSNNQVEDISALSSLTNLTQLTLTGNPISDFSPLLENSGLGEGDQVWLQDSFVDREDRQSYLEVIDGLRNRGVVIHVVSS